MNPSEFSTCYQDTLNGAAPSDELMMIGGESLEFVSPGMCSDISIKYDVKKVASHLFVAVWRVSNPSS